MNDWPFEDPENVATMTVRQVITGDQPILLATHDADDGMWQFLTGDQVQVDDAMIVGLREVYDIDHSIVDLSDLPLGWSAKRKAVGKPWHRFQD